MRPRSTALLARLGVLAAVVAAASLTGLAPAASATPAAPVAAPAAPASADGLQVVALTAGAVHNCATLSDKSLRCWGHNQFGELGNGTTVDAAKPVDVRGLPAAATTTLTRAVHNCSIVGDGAVWCWGMNKYGQLGDGTATNSPDPVPVKGLRKDVRLLGVGGDHTCVTYRDDDTTWCWGQNKYGELGDGRIYLGSRKPVQVKGLPSPPEKLVAALWHTCAVLEDRSTWCWGHNEEGELGVGSAVKSSPKPIQVTGLPSTPTQLTAGLFHTCALVQDGSTWCWGQGKYGQLGTGSTQASSAPKPVVGLGRNPTHLVAGGFHTCAAFADGTMSCWGQNNFGQLGDGATANALKPVRVKGFRPGPTLVAGGSLHTCAAYADGAVNCWGMNASGQLGNGTKTNALTPVAVVGLAGTASKAAPETQQAGSEPGEQAVSNTGGTSIGVLAGIGLPVLAVVGLGLFLATRRSGRGRASAGS